MHDLPNSDQLYNALISRDTRLDGQFFTGVKTTGIYCRAICPAPKPKRENVEFYPSAAAASAAGFRACLRCKPDQSPQATYSDIVLSEALRQIENGFLDCHDVPKLADVLNVQERQLRRLFEHSLAVSPLAVAQQCRLIRAKHLLSQTTKPISAVADFAGYPNTRQLNQAMRQTMHMTPSQFRQEQKMGHRSDASITIALDYRPPYDWAHMLNFLAGHIASPVETVDLEQQWYAATLQIQSLQQTYRGWIKVQAQPKRNRVELSISAELLPVLHQVIARVRAMFDLDADPTHISEALSLHDTLQAVVSRHPGLRLPGGLDRFDMCVRAIAGQLVSVKSATTIFRRIATQYGTPAPENPFGLTHIFPSVQQLAKTVMPDVGLTKVRSNAVQQLAIQIRERQLNLDTLFNQADILQQLTALPGIGPWTAEYIAMRAFKLPDAFPAGDLILRRAVVADTQLTETQCRQQTAHLAPWRAYAAMYLWTDYLESQT